MATNVNTYATLLLTIRIDLVRTPKYEWRASIGGRFEATATGRGSASYQSIRKWLDRTEPSRWTQARWTESIGIKYENKIGRKRAAVA